MAHLLISLLVLCFLTVLPSRVSADLSKKTVSDETIILDKCGLNINFKTTSNNDLPVAVFRNEKNGYVSTHPLNSVVFYIDTSAVNCKDCGGNLFVECSKTNQFEPKGDLSSTKSNSVESVTPASIFTKLNLKGPICDSIKNATHYIVASEKRRKLIDIYQWESSGLTYNVGMDPGGTKIIMEIQKQSSSSRKATIDLNDPALVYYWW